tara:strand:+ start:789 stop:998 length:210 start_codon:yes stop_codon:yes gene_type:complete
MGLEYAEKKWNTLLQLMKQIESDGNEKIKEYTGPHVITNKFAYGLVHGRLSVYDKKDNLLNPPVGDPLE